jgi:hypothetical protein
VNRLLLISAIFLTPIAARAGDTQLKKTPFGLGAEVGFGLVKYHNTCVWFRVVFISDDLFRDFQAHKTANGIEFRRKRDKTALVKFPDPLLVDVEAFPHKCTPELTPPDYASGLMEEPTFKVAWKKGGVADPVELLATKQNHSQLSFGWSYLLTVPTAAVQLTDTLEIDASLRRGMCPVHLTANLDSAQRKLVPTACN